MNITMQAIQPQRLGQLTDAISNMNQVNQQAQALMPPPPTQQDMANKLKQQAATLQEAEDTLSKFWWQQNWPIVAIGAGTLGLVGYLVFKKK